MSNSNDSRMKNNSTLAYSKGFIILLSSEIFLNIWSSSLLDDDADFEWMDSMF